MQVVVGPTQEPLVLAPTVSLSTLAATTPPGALDGLIAVDYQETSDSVIASVHSTNGLPNNFVKISRTGVVTQFSSASGFPEEVYIAIAPSQNCSGTGLSLGGFTVGDVFAGSGFGTGSGATIARISADGTTIQNPFATLPGETGLLWGGLYFDRTGNFGGDLMVSTTTGGIYRVKSNGAATLVARHPTNAAVEGIITLPNDSRFGPLSGKILVGGTDIGLPPTGVTNVLTVDPIDAMHPMGTFTTYSVPEIIEPEGFAIVPDGGDFFGTDFGGSVSATKAVVMVPSLQFTGLVGHLIIASEGKIDPTTKTSKLFDVEWDAVNSQLKTTELVGGSVFQYEGIAFSCVRTQCTASTLSCAGFCISSSSPVPVNFTTPVTTGGTPAVCTPPSGSVFGVGTTTVTCTANDGCGGGAICGFGVTLSLAVISFSDFAGSGSTFTLNTATGAYTFTCGPGAGSFTMTGTGHVVIEGGMILLEDLQGNRCVEVKIDCPSRRAVGTLKSPMGTVRCSIQARNVVCGACTAPPPPT
jgi:hypothetical protein